MAVRIQLAEIEQAQSDWADGIIQIGKTWQDQGDYQSLAHDFLKRHYAYDYECGTVLFKPTKVQDQSFRATLDSALSYFVGGNLEFAEDNGFALVPWQSITFSNHGYYQHHDVATVMGHYEFTDQQKNKTTVEYTFGYLVTMSGELKIFLHHSSLPYSG
jgi:hypothetical protein